MGPRTVDRGRLLEPASNLLTDGDWLNTGDRVSVDGDGWVTYRCRADDIEIVGGLNVNPTEVERLIVEDANVAEAAVVSVRESTGAWALQAFVVPGERADSMNNRLPETSTAGWLLSCLHSRCRTGLSSLNNFPELRPES